MLAFRLAEFGALFPVLFGVVAGEAFVLAGAEGFALFGVDVLDEESGDDHSAFVVLFVFGAEGLGGVFVLTGRLG
ncbi:MAG: hypothetical protein CMJ78_18070 [Planctomycetaceae bacterium]|nr:hypothetical protein [Planctomycetaceae bacterium]